MLSSPSKRQSIGRLLLEAALIVLGVLLGLTLNQWRETRNDDQRAALALRQIEDEIRYNLAQVESSLPNHQAFRDSVGVMLQRFREHPEILNGFTIFTIRSNFTGFKAPLLQTTAWQLAQNTGTINHFDYEQAAELSKLYAQQAFYQKKLDRLSENFYVASNMDPSHMMGLATALFIVTNDILIQERRLTKRYPEMLEKLANTNP